MREGLVWSMDVSPDGKLRASLTPTPQPSRVASRAASRAASRVASRVASQMTLQEWAMSVQANTPFGLQTPPRRAPLRDATGAAVNVLQRELAKDDHRRAAEDAAVRKIEEGLRELKLARKL